MLVRRRKDHEPNDKEANGFRPTVEGLATIQQLYGSSLPPGLQYRSPLPSSFVHKRSRRPSSRTHAPKSAQSPTRSISSSSSVGSRQSTSSLHSLGSFNSDVSEARMPKALLDFKPFYNSPNSSGGLRESGSPGPARNATVEDYSDHDSDSNEPGDEPKPALLATASTAGSHVIEASQDRALMRMNDTDEERDAAPNWKWRRTSTMDTDPGAVEWTKVSTEMITREAAIFFDVPYRNDYGARYLDDSILLRGRQPPFEVEVMSRAEERLRNIAEVTRQDWSDKSIFPVFRGLNHSMHECSRLFCCTGTETAFKPPSDFLSSSARSAAHLKAFTRVPTQKELDDSLSSQHGFGTISDKYQGTKKTVVSIESVTHSTYQSGAVHDAHTAKRAILSVQTNRGDAADALFHWVHLEQETLNFELFRNYVSSIAALDHRMRRYVSEHLDTVRAENENLAVYGNSHRYMASGCLATTHKQSEDELPAVLRWSCMPYLQLTQNSSPRRYASSSSHPSRTLFQTLHRRGDVTRDLKQAACRMVSPQGTSWLSVPQLWALTINDEALITCSTLSRKELVGEAIDILPAPPSTLKLSERLATIHVLKKDGALCLLRCVDCLTWFEFLERIEFELLLDDQHFEVRRNAKLIKPHHWPGILRDAQTAVVRLYIASRSRIQRSDNYHILRITQARQNLSSRLRRIVQKHQRRVHEVERAAELELMPEEKLRLSRRATGNVLDARLTDVIRDAFRLIPQTSGHLVETASSTGKEGGPNTWALEPPMIHERLRHQLNRSERAMLDRGKILDYNELQHALGCWSQEVVEPVDSALSKTIATEDMPAFWSEDEVEMGRYRAMLATSNPYIELISGLRSLAKIHIDPVSVLAPEQRKLCGAIFELVASLHHHILPAATLDAVDLLAYLQLSFVRVWNVLALFTYHEATAAGLRKATTVDRSALAISLHFSVLAVLQAADDCKGFPENRNDLHEKVALMAKRSPYGSDRRTLKLRWYASQAAEFLQTTVKPPSTSQSTDSTAVLPAQVLDILFSRLLNLPVLEGRDVIHLYNRYLSDLDFKIRAGDSSLTSQEELRYLRYEFNAVGRVHQEQYYVLSYLNQVIRTGGVTCQTPEDSWFDTYKSPPRRFLAHMEELRTKQLAIANFEDFIFDLKAESNAKLSEEKDWRENATVVFTIVTVIFLPLSFVASVFGMNTTDIRNANFTQWLFWLTALPLTIGLLAVILWAVDVPPLRRWLWSRSLEGRADGNTVTGQGEHLKPDTGRAKMGDTVLSIERLEEEELFDAKRPSDRLERSRDGDAEDVDDRAITSIRRRRSRDSLSPRLERSRPKYYP